MYDLAIALRVYPGISKTPLIFADNKIKLFELGLASLADSLIGINAKFWIISDGCSNEFDEIISKHLSGFTYQIIKTDSIGNALTFAKQIEILTNQDDSEYVFFVEDDYFFLADSIKKSLDFLRNENQADFLTPFNHPDMYNQDIHKFDVEMIKRADQSWCNNLSTTLTFMCKKKTLLETKDVFLSYLKNNYDLSIWWSLTKIEYFNILRNMKLVMRDRMYFKALVKTLLFTSNQIFKGKTYKLWVPVPSLALHLDITTVSPMIDWDFHIDYIRKKHNI